jgi:hypothetical protein
MRNQYLGVANPRVIKLGLPGYPGAPFEPVSWRQVEGNVEQACSWVATTDILLREVVAMVGPDFLYPIRVSLKERKGLPEFQFVNSILGRE